jgi:trans-aconitate 2-methyltransferase
MANPNVPPSDWDANRYHRISDPQYHWGLAVLDRLVLEGGETVLDAGCGTGRLTAELFRRLPRGQVVALDASPAMLEQARAHLETLGAGRIRFLRRDLLELELDAELDGVFSTATFHWVHDHDRLFRNLFHALKPGGRLCVQCGGGPNLARAHRHAEALMRSDAYAGYFHDWAEPWHFATAEQTEGRLERAGFAEVKAWISPAPTSFPGPDALGEFMRTVILRRHLDRIPDAGRRDTFLAAVVEQLGRDDPPWTLDYWRLNFDAVRP